MGEGEIDLSPHETANLGQINDTMTYNLVISDGFASKSYGPDDGCKLKITWKWTVNR